MEAGQKCSVSFGVYEMVTCRNHVLSFCLYVKHGVLQLLHFDEGVDGQLLNGRDLGSGRWNDVCCYEFL